MTMKKLALVFAVIMAAGAAQAATPEQDKFLKVVIMMTVIKQNLRNPDSVVWEEALVSKDDNYVCIQYRAQNGFGGMSREISVFNGKNGSNKVAFWNKHCLKNMDDFIYAKRAVK